MTERKISKVVENTEHSFEKVLDVPSGTTELTKKRIRSEIKPYDDYDDKDDEIEEDMVNVQDRALELYEYLVDEIDDADQGKRARLAEVAGQMLNTALSATEKRRLMKQQKDILKARAQWLETLRAPNRRFPG